VFAAFTAFVLTIDLERPERFYYIVTRPNWTSWLARGAFLLMGHSAVVALWLLFAWIGWTGAMSWLAPLAIAASVAATAYTGFLFAQGLARDLWQGPHNTIDLMVQAAAEGAAVMLLAAMFVDHDTSTVRALAITLALASLAHLTILALEHLLVPSPTVHHELAVRAIRYGAYRRVFWIGALGLGGLAPVLFVWLASAVNFSLVLLVPAALVALVGSLAWEYVWVEAGQAVPNS
jgi:formate-dependent nitrite reductase membrane component NrfD